MKKHICMIGYTYYLTDARVRREAETLASTGEYKVMALTLKQPDSPPKTYIKDGIEVYELNINKYRGNSNMKYLVSYFKFMLLAFLAVNKLFMKKSLDIVHVHNMPNFLVFSALIPRLFGKKIILDTHDTMLETYLSKFDGMSNKLVTFKSCGIMIFEPL